MKKVVSTAKKIVTRIAKKAVSTVKKTATKLAKKVVSAVKRVSKPVVKATKKAVSTAKRAASRAKKAISKIFRRRWMKKKFSLKKLIMLSIILLFSYLYAQYNIRSNSLYYARHTQYSKEVDPEIMMLIKNWTRIHIPTPNGYRANTNYRKSFGYGFKNKNKDEYVYGNLGIDEYKYPTISYSVDYKNNNSESYELMGGKKIVFSKIFYDERFEYYFKENGSYSPQKEKEIYYKVRQLIKPILDANIEPPLINLQWLFDLKYKDYLK